jgi:ribosome-binding factor A
MASPRRHEQLGAILREAIQARIDRGLADPRIAGMITVTGVKVAPDLKTATVMVSVMPHDKQDLTVHGLKSAARHIRREVGDEVSLARMPDLTFRLDKSLEKQAGVLDAIARAAAEREAKEKAGPGVGEEPDQAERGDRRAYAEGTGEDPKA